jgi:uncharacterized protein YecE (DUF72 family)
MSDGAKSGLIRVGIGGWTFAPWRGVFYPKGMRQKDELAFASRRLTAIEINATYYSTFSAKSFGDWASQTPQDFVFAIKASRFCTNRKVLADVGPAIDRFMAQGLEALEDRIGPILWQFMHTKRFDPVDFAAFLALLPKKLGARPLRHAVEVRHESFVDARFVSLCRDHGVAICASDHGAYPLIDEATADFRYARLMRGRDDIETGYPVADLDGWAETFKVQAADGRDVFVFFISGGKVRAPAAAMALQARVSA